MSDGRAWYLMHLPLGPEAMEPGIQTFWCGGCWRRYLKKEAECSGLELRVPEEQLRSYLVGEREGEIGFEAEAQRLEEVPLLLLFVRGPSHRYILFQPKLQMPEKDGGTSVTQACLCQWLSGGFPGPPLSSLHLGLLTAREIGVKWMNPGGPW